MGFEIIIIILLVVLWLRHNKHIHTLQDRLDRLEGKVPAEQVTQEEKERHEDSVLPKEYHERNAEYQKELERAIQEKRERKGSSVGEQFTEWIKEDWLMKLGALLIFVAVIFFVFYAFANDWIGPVGRITLGLVVGTAVVAFGSWWMKRHIHQGGILLLLGSGIVILTVYGARFVYGFFTPVSALIIMFLAVAISAASSVRYRSYWVTLVSLLLASFIPFLTHPADPDMVSLFLYLLIVILGTIWVVALTSWRSLVPISLGIATLYSLPAWSFYGTDDDGVLLIIAFIYTALFFITNIIAIIQHKRERLVPDLITAVGTGIFLMLWIFEVVPAVWQSLILVAWMLVFAGGAFAVTRKTSKPVPFFIYTAVSVMFLAAATAVELSGPALVIAYTIEAGALSLVAFFLSKDIKLAERLSIIFVVPVFMSLPSFFASSWNQGVIHNDLFVLLIVMMTMLTVGSFFLQKHIEEKSESYGGALVFLVGSSIYFLALIWLISHAVFLSNDFATGLSLTIYTVIGIASYIIGRTKDHEAVKYYGGILLGIVVARLLLVEVGTMDLIGKVITFALIGVLLISTAFIGRVKKENKETYTE